MGATSIKARARIVIAILIVAAVGIVTLELLDVRARQDSAMETLLEKSKTRFENSLLDRLATVAALAQSAVNFPNVAQAIADNDRLALNGMLEEGFTELKKSQGLKTLVAHQPPATVITRVHNTKKYDDDISGFREMVVRANAERVQISGIEIGRAGLSIRSVAPVQHEGVHVGSIEYGLAFGPGLLSVFKDATGIDATLHLLRDQGMLELAATTSDVPLKSGADAGSWDMEWLRDALKIDQVDARVASDTGRAGVISFPLPDYNDTIIGTLTLQIPASTESATRLTDTLFVVAIPIVLIIVIIAIQVIIGGIVGPLGRLSDVMMAMSKDQVSVEIPDRDRSDEIGKMARSLVVFQEHISERFRIATAAKRQKEVDQQMRDEEMRELSSEFDSTVRKVADSIARTSAQINAAATATAGRTDTGSVDAIGVANTAQSILEGAQSIAGSAEELAASVTEINQQATTASQLSDEALQDVGTAQSQIEQLAGSVDQIRNVVALIEDIAEQTNLLALNATIEAARAGEAGKGFAVVAAEVKQLATQTGQATESIGQQIAAIMSESEQAVEAMRRVDSVTNRMQEISTAIAGAVEEQGAVTREIASQISHSSTEIDTLSTGVSAIALSVVRTCGKSIEVLWEADGLEQRSQELANESSRFLKVMEG